LTQASSAAAGRPAKRPSRRSRPVKAKAAKRPGKVPQSSTAGGGALAPRERSRPDGLKARPTSHASKGDGLAKYRAKRDFKKTAEPAGRKGKMKGHRLVIQK